MSFLHHNSCECTKSELDLFSLLLTQTSIGGGQLVNYKPVSSLSDDAPLEFVVPGHGDEYVDLSHTLINITARITGIKDEEQNILYGPVNLWLHSLFSQIDIFLNQKLVTPPSHAYPYRAYIETLLNYGPAAKTSQLTSALWYGDTPGFMDDCVNNAGAIRRRVFKPMVKKWNWSGKEGRRWTYSQNVFALSMFKKSPKACNFMRTHYLLGIP
ncbi:hypothetical protein J437_LFUL008033 [Ladona fulva]|uniref:Uncharacterized protein n=1 Tax=Ladona fulva TaxID=123851 RepID=A0A8K0KGB5_LADFU|nr:hypothetical protein J437_LFUL008033 [Ladona fulva]